MAILTFPETQRRTGCPRDTLYWLARRGLFVRPVKRGSRSAGFPEVEVEAIVAARVAGMGNDQIRALVDALHDRRAPAAEAAAAAALADFSGAPA